MSEPTIQSEAWRRFYETKAKGNYPKWPSEPMLKCLFGAYSRAPLKPQPDWRVLDIGCGFGANLLPFAELGCECHGVEIDPEICTLVEGLLGERGLQARLQPGHNRALPYDTASFDLLLSVATIHYEGTEENVAAALQEFRRVLKPGGLAYIATVGPDHEIYRRAELLGGHRYRVRDYDFRDGQQMFFFDSERYLAHYCGQAFATVEVGRITEWLLSNTVDSLIALCR